MGQASAPKFASIVAMRTEILQRLRTDAACLLIAVLVVAGCNSKPTTGVDGATQERPRSIYALGTLEPAGGIIAVSAIPGERLMELDPDVAENKRVPENGVLGLLASYDVGKAQLAALNKKKELSEKNRVHQIEVAKAQKSQAEASLAQAKAKLKELELQGEKLVALKVASEIAVEEFVRLEALRATDHELVTEHQLRKRENEMQTALADFKIANDSFASAKEAADKTVAAAEANIKVADLTLTQLDQAFEIQAVAQEIDIAKETLKRSILLSPHVSPETLDNVLEIETKADHEATSADDRGPLTVLKIFLRPGEFVSQMPIMQLGDLSEMVCVAEVYEADVKNLKIGQAAVIRSPAFAGKFADGLDPETKQRTGGIAGKIEQIGGVIGSPGLANRNPLAPADRSVVEVRIALDEAATAETSHRVGLQVTVEFEQSATEEAPADATP
jgi:HlyD family secretion protein